MIAPPLLGTQVTNTPAGAIAATTVQAAINELDTEKQPVDAELTALAGLNATAGLVEQTGAAAFTKRLLGVGAATSVPTRADADARYAGIAGVVPITLGGSGQITAPLARTAFDVPSNSEVLARQWSAQGHVKFDGVTSGQRGTAWIPGMNIGTNDVTISIRARIPTTISGNPHIIAISSVVGSAGKGSVAVSLAGSDLYINLSGDPISNYYQIILSGFVSTYGGLEVVLSLVRSGGSLLVYANKSTLAYSGAAHGVTSFSETISGQYIEFGGRAANLFNDHITSVDVFNYALTAAQVAEFIDFGITSANRPWPANTAYGMNQIANIERNSVFSAAATDWATTGTSTISAAGAAVFAAVGECISLAPAYQTQYKAGQLHRVSFTVASGTYGGNSATLYLADSVAGTTKYVTIGTVTANGNYWFEFTPTTGVHYLLFQAVGGALNFTLSNVVVSPVVLTNGSFETLGGGGADVFAGWVETVSAPSTISVSVTGAYAGVNTCKFTGGAGNEYIDIQSTAIKGGQLYRFSAWVISDNAAAVISVSDTFTGQTKTVPTSWSLWTFDAVAKSGQLIIKRQNLAGMSVWLDNVELIPLGNIASFSPWGLDNHTLRWANQAGSGDATLFGMTLDAASGIYPNIVIGQARLATLDENTRLSRERRALMGGGIYFAGGAGQAGTAIPIPAQDIDVGAFWFQWSGEIPSAAPASTAGGLFLISSSLTTTAAACANAGIDTSGNLLIRVFGATTSDYRQAQISNIVSMYGGKVPVIVGCRTATGLQVWINGSPTAYIETVAGTPPTWAADLTSTNYHFGLAASGQRTLGSVFVFRVGRGTLTQALIDELISTGLRIASGSAISKGGSFSGATDGCVFDANCAEGGGNELIGRSGNNAHFFLPLTTHTHLNPKTTGLVLKDTLIWAGGSHEAKSIGGTAVTGGVLLPLNAIIRSIALRSTAASIAGITIGDGTTANKYVLLAPMAIGYNNYTLVTGLPDGTHQAMFIDPDSANWAGTIDVTVVYDLVQ